jgi:XTP/dITP diphosphohydrolase
MNFDQTDPQRVQKLEAFDRLLTIMDQLRTQCPWDRKQTLGSLRHLTIEETYELSDAIMENNLPEIKKELGDIMLHLVFYARIASETGHFHIGDVLHSVCDKLVARHPHIYGNAQADTEEQVKQNWEQLKLQEGNASTLSGVPSSLPALVKAMRIQEKARGAGFDWDEKHQVWEKVQEELHEFGQEYNPTSNTIIDDAKAEAEFGDLLFSLINFSRFIGINAETALERTNKKFIKRFMHIESRAKQLGKTLKDMTLAEMDVYWEEAKRL